MRLGIVGAGRLGRSLAVLLERAGHEVDLRGRGQGLPDGEAVLLAVPDTALPSVAAGFPGGRVVLHCSGASPVEVLRPHHPAGSLHPLMTFPGPEVALPELAGVPACVAGDAEALATAGRLATDLGMRPFEVPGDRRLYHAAAVMAGNFATVLLAEASRALQAAGVPPEEAPGLLAPLAITSLRNAVPHPASALTGPVVRGDEAVLQAHRDALREAGLIEQLPLYDLLIAHARRLARPTREDPDG